MSNILFFHTTIMFKMLLLYIHDLFFYYFFCKHIKMFFNPQKHCSPNMCNLQYIYYWYYFGQILVYKHIYFQLILYFITDNTELRFEHIPILLTHVQHNAQLYIHNLSLLETIQSFQLNCKIS